jgi:predicted enzyme related to lactoylglutathione lyase
MTQRQSVIGIGGIFFKSSDPSRLRAWYEENLGIAATEYGTTFEDGGPIVWSPFASDTTYFAPSEASFMINYRVRDLDKMLAQLRAAGATVDDKVEEMEGVGRFGHAMDPDGNRFELWEPAKKS